MNAARDMAAIMSSVAPQGGAVLAVDGNTSATWCSFTDFQRDPWWRVDLALLYDVWHVTVTNFEHGKGIVTLLRQ